MQKQNIQNKQKLQVEGQQANYQLSQKKINVSNKIFRTVESLYLIKLKQAYYKFRLVSVKKSKEYLIIKSQELINSLHRISLIKMLQYQQEFFQSMKILMQKKRDTNMSNRLQVQQANQKKISHIQMIKNIRSNRINIKNKGEQQRTKNQKNIKFVVEKIKKLQNSLNLYSFYKIKSFALNSLTNKKTTYLWHYMANKRYYWLSFAFQKLKCNILFDRGTKSVQQITHLDTKLAPIQDAQLQSIKQKQNKLKAALDNVNFQKQKIQEQINKEVSLYKQQTAQKYDILSTLKQKKVEFQQQFNKYQNSSKHPLSSEQIYYYAYINFLINAQIYQQYFPEEQLNKSTVLQWLQQPFIPLPQMAADHTQELINWLGDLINQYKRVSTKENPRFNQISNKDLMRSQKSYQILIKQSKYMYKALSCLIQRTSGVANQYVKNIQDCYQKLNGQTESII